MPDRARHLPDRHDRRARAQDAVEVALQLRVPQRQLEAEGHRLGVHAVRAADHRRPAVLLGAHRAPRPSAPAMPLTMRSQASRICSACAVSTTSDEVSPKCSQRAAGPTFSATAVVNAMTSCCVVRSISSMRAMSKAARARRLARRVGGHEPGVGHRVGGGQFDLEPRFVATLLAPNRAHLGVCVPLNHEVSVSPNPTAPRQVRSLRRPSTVDRQRAVRQADRTRPAGCRPP